LFKQLIRLFLLVPINTTNNKNNMRKLIILFVLAVTVTAVASSCKTHGPCPAYQTSAKSINHHKSI
jgi:hypothetical protein